MFQSPIQWPMLIHGGTGTGKTYAACCIYQLWPQAFDEYGQGPKWEPMFVDCQAQAAELTQARRDNSSGRILRRIGECTLLVLDEIGRREITAPQLDALLDIINRRGEKPTILTSNKSPVELIQVLGDQRIVDRIQGTVVEYTGSSQRAARVKRERV